MNVTSNILTTNFGGDRKSAFPISMIVIHVTEGDKDSVVSWFENPTAKVSAHYMVCKDGTIVHFVREEDTAWHAGRVDHPTSELVIARLPSNPNGYSIGIEHEGDGKHEMTDAQRASSLELIKDICARHAIPIDRVHIVGHHEVYSLKTCPGEINVDALVRDAAA